MRTHHYFLLFLIVISVHLQSQNLASKVNPFIGTGGHGHTYPGATVPFGMVQLSPDTRIDGSWDGCGGYHYNDSVIYGFSHTHLSGTGVSDYGDVQLMPIADFNQTTPQQYGQRFSHQDEVAFAGFYHTVLPDLGIELDLTSTEHCGIHRYTYRKSRKPRFILDLNHRDKLLSGHIAWVNDSTIEGYRQSEAWATNQKIYFRMCFSEPIKQFSMHSESLEKGGFYGANQRKFALLEFRKGIKELTVKVSLSAVDYLGASINLLTESEPYSFDQLRAKAEDLWNKQLGKIKVSSEDSVKQKIFYTALYHCFTSPNVFSDVDGRYRGRDQLIHQLQSGKQYTVFSLWDTFRALHPLLTWLEPERTADFINTFIRQYEQGGRVPVWELAANETECMIGYHAVPVIADAMFKGIEGFDQERAYLAARASAMKDHFGLKAYKNKGYIEIEDEHESVSKTLEYAYDDWCLAQMAGYLGYQADYEYFTKRSYNWVNVFDPVMQHMRPRSNGGWLSPFDAYRVDNNFTEANSWQYSFFVLHHFPEFVKASGGIKRFKSKLDELFSTSSKTTGREQSDITGLIGQYAHGNEPSHHMIYQYALLGYPEHSQRLLRKVMDEFYKNDPDGLIGNEDCGQMSAWLVWSALGMYPYCPGKSYLTLGTPWFDSVEVALAKGGKLAITAKGGVKEKHYVETALFNGDTLEGPTIQFSQINGGGHMVFQMSDEGQSVWKKTEAMDLDYPWKFTPAPTISSTSLVFRDSMKVEIKAAYPFIVDLAGRRFGPFQQSAHVWIKNSSELRAYSASDSIKADSSRAIFYKIPNQWSVSSSEVPNPQYTGGGSEALIDGLEGDVNWRKGRWQGYQGRDVDFELDLKEVLEVSDFYVGCLQDTRAWILMPKRLTISYSEDGKQWKEGSSITSGIDPSDYKEQRKELILPVNARARYIRLKLEHFGLLPEWHAGAGYPAFFFLDELGVR